MTTNTVNFDDDCEKIIKSNFEIFGNCKNYRFIRAGTNMVYRVGSKYIVKICPADCREATCQRNSLL